MKRSIYFILIKLVRKLQNAGYYHVSKPIAKATFAIFK